MRGPDILTLSVLAIKGLINTNLINLPEDKVKSFASDPQNQKNLPNVSKQFLQWFSGFVDAYFLFLIIILYFQQELVICNYMSCCIPYLATKKYCEYYTPSMQIYFSPKSYFSSTYKTATSKYFFQSRNSSKSTTGLTYKNKSLIVWGQNLPSTVGEKFTRKELEMVKLPSYQYSVVIGLILSDGCFISRREVWFWWKINLHRWSIVFTILLCS